MVDGVNNQTSVLKGTTIAAGIGGTVGAARALYTQHKWLKNPVECADKFTRSLHEMNLAEALHGKNPFFPFAKKLCQSGLDTIKSGKINWKLVGIGAAYDAVLLGGAYLAYRGIKALFTKSDKA